MIVNSYEGGGGRWAPGLKEANYQFKIIIPSSPSFLPPTKEDKSPSFLAALSRALMGALGFFFRRPVRLFRPVKISSLMGIQAVADERKEKVYSFKFIKSLIKEEGWRFFPTHILPPLIINSIVGFTLFFTYTFTSTSLLSYFPPPSPSSSTPAYSSALSFNSLILPFISGAAAGASQSFISTPLDNAKLLLLQRQTYLRSLTTTNIHSSRHSTHSSTPYTTWKSLIVNSVFHPLTPIPVLSSTSSPNTTSVTNKRLVKARLQFQSAYNSFWTVMSKDTLSFACFFTIFECGRTLSRMIALDWDGITEYDLLESKAREGDEGVDRRVVEVSKKRSKGSLIIQSFLILFSGGIAGWFVNFIGRPFDRIRELAWNSRNTLGKEGIVLKNGSWMADFREKKRSSERRRARSARISKFGLIKKKSVKAVPLSPISTFDLIKNSTKQIGYYKFFFSPTSHPTINPSSLVHPKPTRLSYRHHLAKTQSKALPVVSRGSLGFRSLKVLAYAPPYSLGLLVYALMNGDLN